MPLAKITVTLKLSGRPARSQSFELDQDVLMKLRQKDFMEIVSHVSGKEQERVLETFNRARGGLEHRITIAGANLIDSIPDEAENE